MFVREQPALIPAPIRMRWLRELHPDVDVRLLPGFTRDEGAASLAGVVRALLGGAPDTVFGSTGDENLAQALGCAFGAVDSEQIPVESSAIRADPLAHLGVVPPCVRAYLVRRVCLIGPESTGKTTLAERLADRYRTTFVPEYGRAYTLDKLRSSESNRWRESEFVHIAREQQRRSPGIVVCDTDAFATQIWLERYLGDTATSDGPSETPVGWPTRDRPMDLYLLEDPNVPFVADEIRDGERLRTWMFDRFRRELERRALRYEILRGSYAQREAQAVTAIDALVRPAPLESYPR